MGSILVTALVLLHLIFQDDGKIVKTGDISIAKLLEEEGYKAISTA